MNKEQEEVARRMANKLSIEFIIGPNDGLMVDDHEFLLYEDEAYGWCFEESVPGWLVDQAGEQETIANKAYERAVRYSALFQKYLGM